MFKESWLRMPALNSWKSSRVQLRRSTTFVGRGVATMYVEWPENNRTVYVKLRIRDHSTLRKFCRTTRKSDENWSRVVESLKIQIRLK
ncbi:hypothetical protein AVEN_204549-1 [Araneus ventricosus]|uniref:Uncharacterized protein n=1 Tax=Araneus ventricosus TaxID=182803 RepID=A0A4Y2MA61_ARAVE|nr:hypothetical protein AVEN_204549-1 [Araneus ventricosus]